MVTVGIVVVVVIFAAIWASRYTKVGPNEVLVVSGRKHRYADPDGTRQMRGFRISERRRHVRHPGGREGGPALAGTADH